MDYVDDYLTSLSRVVAAMPREEIRQVTTVLLDAWRRDATVFLLGNGGSAATASHMANDLNKQTQVPGKRRFRSIALTDNVPLLTAWGNDSAYEDVFVEQLLNLLRAGDVVVGISTSGESMNVLKALQAAREVGAVTIGLSGRHGGRLKAITDHCLLVPSDQIGQQEDLHLILNHVIAGTLRQHIAADPPST